MSFPWEDEDEMDWLADDEHPTPALRLTPDELRRLHEELGIPIPNTLTHRVTVDRTTGWVTVRASGEEEAAIIVSIAREFFARPVEER